MKINEVEALVGITKKNIRFYEEQGLLKPGRNSQNGYREYGEPEVELLRQIKLLRKLGVPLEEIRQMQTGSRTLGDGMRRHLVTLERERKNLDQAVQFCQALKDREVRLDSLDAGGLLREMEQMEQEGATFLDRQQGDTRRIRYVAPVVVTLLTVFLMGGLIALMLWGFSIDAEDAPPLSLLVVGSLLAGMSAGQVLRSPKLWLLTAIRLLLLPVALCLVLRALGIDSLVLGIAVTQMAMPVAVNGTLLSMEYGGDTECMAQITFLTTAASIVTIPIVAVLLL